MKRYFLPLFLLTIVLSAGAKNYTHYLFVYFTSNSTEGQQVCYAVSDNGLDFTPLNGGSPVLASDSISVSGGAGY